MKDHENSIDVFTEWCHSEYMYDVLNRFCVELTNNKITAKESLESAKETARENILHILKEKYYVGNINSNNTTLIKKKELNIILDDILQGGAQIICKEGENINVLYPFTEGQCKDDSVIINNKINYKFYDFYRLRSDLDLIEIYSKLQKNRFVNIYGVPGSGKSRFVKILTLEMLERNLFPDGIKLFYIKDLYKEFCKKNVEQNIDLRELLNSEFNYELSKNITKYFKERSNMLIILDQFDIISEEKKLPCSRLFFESIYQSNVKMIFCTREKISRQLSDLFIEEEFSLIEKLEYYETFASSPKHSVLKLFDNLMNEKGKYVINFNANEQKKNPSKIIFKFSDINSYEKILNSNFIQEIRNPWELKLDTTLSKFVRNELNLNFIDKKCLKVVIELQNKPQIN